MPDTLQQLVISYFVQQRLDGIDPNLPEMHGQTVAAATDAVKRFKNKLLVANPCLSEKFFTASQWFAAYRCLCVNYFEPIPLILQTIIDHQLLKKDFVKAWQIGSNMEKLALILAKKITVNELDNNRRTPLHFAVMEDYAGLVKKLLSDKATVNTLGTGRYSPLHYAATNGNAEIVATLLAHDADVNQTTSALFSPLHFAVLSGETSIVEQLLEYKADINACNLQGSTALHLAGGKNDRHMYHFLVQQGADETLNDSHGKTAYQYLTQKKYRKTM